MRTILAGPERRVKELEADIWAGELIPCRPGRLADCVSVQLFLLVYPSGLEAKVDSALPSLVKVRSGSGSDVM